jgi:N-acetyl-anhydromuramyl-L-alanine amidase AmpD
MVQIGIKHINRDFSSPNFSKRHRIIDIIVIHSTHIPCKESIEVLCNQSSNVSCHYLIDLNGKIYQLVEDEKKAWHAGKSYWRGKSSINDNSIGIELVDTDDKGARLASFPKAQMDSLIDLLKPLIKKYNIPSYNIVAHSDIAPDRKDDPGENFDWSLLAAHKIGRYHTVKLDNQILIPKPHFLPSSRRRPGPSTTKALSQLQLGSSANVVGMDPFVESFVGLGSGLRRDDGRVGVDLVVDLKHATIAKVKEIQRMLKNCGYKIKITGKFDPQTLEVITAFRRHFNPVGLNKGYFSSIDFQILSQVSVE